MPSRRHVIGVAGTTSLALAGCLTAPTADDRRATESTPPRIRLDRVSAAAVESDATIGLLPGPIRQAIDGAIETPPAPTSVHEDRHVVLTEFPVTYDGDVYDVDTVFHGGNSWYENYYTIVPGSDPDPDEEVLVVTAQSDPVREALTAAIETGEYTYQSMRDDVDLPIADVYRYEGEYYRIGQHVHADYGPTLALECTPIEVDEAAVLEPIDVRSPGDEAALETAMEAGAVPLDAVSAAVCDRLADVSFVTAGFDLYAIELPALDSA
ncbi:MAG: hypothetical protein ACQETB_08490 [Halobacteriota archaeon]